MSRISRATQVIFGSAGLVGTGGFGAAAAGNVATELATSSSISTLTGTTAWGNGWLDATLGSTKFPAIEDMNAQDYVITTQLAYLLQQGIAEYDASSTYYTNNIVCKAGTYQLYGSVTNGNTGHPLTDPTNWLLLGDLSTLAGGGVPTGTISAFGGSSAPAGYVLCYGQAISRTTFAALFSAIGTTWGVGDGSTTFNLPDLRGRALSGVDNMGGTPANRITNGVSGITGTTLGASGGDQSMQSHTHTASVTDGGHSHTTASNPAVNLSGGPSNVAGSGGGFTSTAPTNSATTGISVSNTSTGSGSSQNMPPTAMVNYIIKT